MVPYATGPKLDPGNQAMEQTRVTPIYTGSDGVSFTSSGGFLKFVMVSCATGPLALDPLMDKIHKPFSGGAKYEKKNAGAHSKYEKTNALVRPKIPW